MSRAVVIPAKSLKNVAGDKMEKQAELFQKSYDGVEIKIGLPNKCGVCGRPVKKLSKKMLDHPKRACGLCRGKLAAIKPIEKRVKAPEDIIHECLRALATEPYLWDMRAWNRYKDRDEIGAYIDNPDFKNCGSCQHCIEQLKALSIDKELIIQAIMDNPHIQYKDRLVPCMLDRNPDAYDDKGKPNSECPKVQKQGHYGDGICNKCDGKPEPIEFEITTVKGYLVKVKFDREFSSHFQFYGPSISETGYRSEFLGFSLDMNDVPDEKIPEIAQRMADKLEIEEELLKLKKARQARRKKKNV